MSNYALWGLFGPATWAWWLSTASLACLLSGRSQRWARRLGAAALIVFILFAILPTGYWLAEPLERRFPQIDTRRLAIRNIVVLSGAEALGVSARSGRLEVGSAGERILEGASLAQLHPAARLWIVGGVRDPRSPRADVDWTAQAWRSLGVDASHIRTIDGTHDTCGNAQGIAAQRLRGPTLLVTSAIHMPRAVGCFHAQGVTVIPYPVDYQNDARRSLGDYLTAGLLGNVERTDAALHEWVGLVYYRLKRRTPELLPS